jgi:hypothetical protein
MHAFLKKIRAIELRMAIILERLKPITSLKPQLTIYFLNMARSNGNVNDVAMQGSGVYKRNSELQREGLLRALPLLQAATEACSELGNDLLRVVDYGAAHGNNS